MFANLQPVECLWANVPSIRIFVFTFSAVFIFFGVFKLANEFHICNSSQIYGLFQIPGYPIVGNMFQVMTNPALVYMGWVKKYNRSIFQVKLGNTTMVIVNSYKDIDGIWNGHSSCLRSRPFQYTFHNIVSSTQGFTVGSTPYDESYRKKKKAVSQLVNQRSVDKLTGVIDRDISYMLRYMIKQNPELSHLPSTNSNVARSMFPDVDLMTHCQYCVLKTAVNITYGARLDCYTNDKELCDRIIETERQIIHLRSPVGSLSDYFPILRRIYGSTMMASHLRSLRDAYLHLLHGSTTIRSEFRSSIFMESFVGRALTGKLSGISDEEIRSVCLTMISAGLDNTPLTINHLIGQLSRGTRGKKLQARAYKQILANHNQSLREAWSGVTRTMNCDFVVALLKEALRFFTVLPLSLPRVTTKEFTYDGMTFPENTTFIMNAYAANHDPAVFERPYDFLPERWIDSHNKLIPKNELHHFSFGSGSRMCSGNILAMKQMYILTCRLILLFKIKEPRAPEFTMEPDPFRSNSNPRSTSFEPLPFKVRLVPRVGGGLDDLYRDVFNITS